MQGIRKGWFEMNVLICIILLLNVLETPIQSPNLMVDIIPKCPIK